MKTGQGFKLDDGRIVDLETYLASPEHAADIAKNMQHSRMFCLAQGMCPWCGGSVLIEAPDMCEEPENHEGYSASKTD